MSHIYAFLYIKELNRETRVPGRATSDIFFQLPESKG